MKVLKFGGTSVGSPSAIAKVKHIISQTPGQKTIVVSAFGGVTDELLHIGNLAERGDNDCFIRQEALIKKHISFIEALFAPEEHATITRLVAGEFEDLRSIIKAVNLIRELSRKSLENLSGIGERLSSKILARYLHADWYDSRKYIKTVYDFGKNRVLSDVTYAGLKSIRAQLGELSLFPGFIAGNKNNDSTTLGRGGSDYTASLLAVGFMASELQIWTDVDGFMTADPRIIKRAYCIDQLSYAEAMELSHFGAKVIYPPTIIPVHEKNIPVLIKNTFNPQAKGTLINNLKVDIRQRQIKGISSITGISLLTVHGIGMVGVTGISMRVFAALAKKDINIILISQASSENSITIAIEKQQTEEAREAIEKEFGLEIEAAQVNKVKIDDDIAIVAIVGENMKHTPGISGHLFNSIGNNGINIYTIAQGASELNISFAIHSSDLRKALNIIHEAFFLSDYVRLNLFLAGKGTVGSQLLARLGAQSEQMLKNHNLQLRLAGLAGQSKMLFDEQGIDPSTAIATLSNSGETGNIANFKDRAIGMNLPNSVFIDCTASEEVAAVYQDLLDNNISVVTANKIAGSSSYATYKRLKETARKKGIRFFFETNVGAGLPIIAPINDLVKSGDKILRLEAVLSGTLNYIVNTISAEKPLSVVIEEARQKGFSEPDPRIDLSGKDVARKILILARESGYMAEPSDVAIEPFVPDAFLQQPSYEAFLSKVKNELDSVFEQRRARAQAAGKRIRYGARLLDGKLTTGMVEVDHRHPFYDLEGSNNVVLIWSDNYNEHPLIVKGYGAGAEVTAIGVFADIIKVANI